MSPQIHYIDIKRYLIGSEEHFHSPILFVMRVCCIVFIFIVPPLKSAEEKGSKDGKEGKKANETRYKGMAEVNRRMKVGCSSVGNVCGRVLGSCASNLKGREVFLY